MSLRSRQHPDSIRQPHALRHPRESGDPVRSGSRLARILGLPVLGPRFRGDDGGRGDDERGGDGRGASSILTLAALLLLALPLAAAAQQGAVEPHPGNAKLYIGTYTSIVVVDEATATVEEEIRLESGIPRSMVLSADQNRFYVLNTMYEDIEVVDIATRRSIDRHNLSSGSRKVRISSFNVDPQERYAILLAKTYDRLSDRFEVSRPLLLRYDLRSRQVTDTIAWPEGEARENARMIFSPDGELMYFFGDEILIFDTDDFSEVDRWAYEEALGEGIGRFEFGFPDQSYEEPGYYTGLFRTTDPIQSRRLMGVARVNLATRDIEFRTLGPNENVSFALAPDRRTAYGLQQAVGNYQFWAFDVESGRVLRREPFVGRPRMSLMPSSSGEVFYVYNAGNTIDLYDADTFEFMRRIDLNVDSSTGLFVLPAAR